MSTASAGQKRKQPSPPSTTNTNTTKVGPKVGPKVSPKVTGVAKPEKRNASSRWDEMKSKILVSMSTDLPSVCTDITELRDKFELVHPAEYPTMLSALLPVFASILQTIPCTPSRDAAVNRLPSYHDGKSKNNSNSNDAEKEKPEYLIRTAVLEICTRLPQSEIVRPYITILMDLSMNVIQNDYESNALLAARIMFDLHKSFRPMLSGYVQPFLDFVLMSYRGLPNSIKQNFTIRSHPIKKTTFSAATDTATATALATDPKPANTSGPTIPGAASSAPAPATSLAPGQSDFEDYLNQYLVKSSASFRVLTECPLSVMLLFQLYPKYIKSNLLQLLPLMMDALAQRPPPHTLNFIGPEPLTSKTASEGEEKKILRALFRKRAKELLSAQVKTLSFVTHLLRGYSDHIKPYEDRLATNVLNLFQICPREALTIRKDLLIALRHIFATNFRKGFFRHVDTLLDERLLIGKHRQSEHAQLRAAAYSALADLLLHVRSRLSMAQVSRVVHLYSRVLHDASMHLPLVVQTASVSLLLNMVDPVYHNKEEKASLGRDILFRILETLVWKLGMLVDHGIADVREAEKRSERLAAATKERQQSNEKYPSCGNEICEFMYGSKLTDSLGTVQHIRDLIKPLLPGIKTLIWCINNYGAQREKLTTSKEKSADSKSKPKKEPAQKSWYEDLAVQKIHVGERALIEKYFVWTLEVLKIFKDTNQPSEQKDVKTEKKEYQEVLEKFALSLSVLDSFNFQRIVGSQMSLLIKSIVEDEDIIAVPQTFLLQNLNKNFSISTDFTSCLLHKLMENANELDIGIAESSDEKVQHEADVKMKLFSMIFSSLSVCPNNEKILRPFLQQLVATCLRRAMGSDVMFWPGNHFKILRKLFRAIAGGKFEESYKEILPLLPTLLNGLYRIYCHTNHDILRKVIIELCLTIPARLSSLLPHLSLLLRIIVPALKTNDGDLINLGLRTLEFWVDNLNTEFLFPILSQDDDLFADLMTTLSTHLRPAPYQYGLLTLRLLGKLGGKNRTFLRSPMLVSSDCGNESEFFPSIECKWNLNPVIQNTAKDDNNLFSLRIPLHSAMLILEKVSMKPKDGSLLNLKNSGLRSLMSLLEEECAVGKLDINLLRDQLLQTTVEEQARAAFDVVRGAIEIILDDVGKFDPEKASLNLIKKKIARQSEEKSTAMMEDSQSSGKEMYINFLNSVFKGDMMLQYIFKALFYSSRIDILRDDASILLEGLMKHWIIAVAPYQNCVRREDDAEQLVVPKDTSSSKEKGDRHVPKRVTLVQNGKLQPLMPFGRFVFIGDLKGDVNYFIFNEVLADVLLSREEHLVKKALDMITKLIGFGKKIEVSCEMTDNAMDTSDNNLEELPISKVCAENLLFQLCQACMSCRWESRSGLFAGICLLLEIMDQEWCRLFEVELFHVSMFCMKHNPLEAALAQKEALIFHLRLLILLYTAQESRSACADLIHESNSKCESSHSTTEEVKASTFPCSDAVPSMFVTELVSTKSIVRFAARYGLKFLYGNEKQGEPNSLQEIITKYGAIMKRHLFSKSLRNLQLTDQIATIETFAYIVKNAPGTVPLSDSHVLVFLSESLKMMSVADGEMTSESISSAVIINKDGYSPRVPLNSCMVNKFSSLSHATGIFLREGFDIVFRNSGNRVQVKSELPMGVQLRVSSLQLFHEVLKKHSDSFLEAEASSSVGNILPHIVSLLFRSLTSRPEDAVNAAYDALKEILSLSAKSKDGESQNTHRLPKNLLQMCIRPVLVNLRDYTKLTIPLLCGLSRLLSLLSSWFSKTLGEKLLDHLQKWADPEKITSLRIWKKGEEPFVAAAIIDLFQLLPDESSHFVEPLIKTTLKLEGVLRHYNTFLCESPFRAPLAKYLNNHGSAVALFFINEHRFKNPIYSELLQDLSRRQESNGIRKHLSSVECSNMLLNVCFERPLSIIRSEKGANSSSSRSPASSSRTPADTLSMHGIIIDLSSKKLALKQEIKAKEDKLQTAKRDESKAQENMLKRAGDLKSTVPNEKRLALAAQKRLTNMKASVEKLQKEAATLQADYAKKFARDDASGNEESKRSTRSMTLDSLELQHQGFCLIETLMRNDESYISGHHDVVRAFRWLWRSKGRHFRLLHEDAISPRYNGESKYLARFLVNYSKTAPHDVDVLFDLLRIFLQPTSSDFSFVQKYLRETVCDVISLEQKRTVMQRFFPVIASEGIEELKVLSIQLLVLPMLKDDFEKCAKLSNCSESITTEQKCAAADNKEDSTMQGVVSAANQNEVILNKDLTAKFVAEVLVKGTEHRTYGSRLSIELLKLCSLLLDHMGGELDQHQQTIMKFAWSVLKSEDSKAIQWAYIAICKFIVMFDSPPKITLQVYVSLLRSHQQETRDVVNTALDILIPVLSSKLSPDNYSRAMKATINILFEEGNIVPQLSHLWHIIVRHKHVFSRNSDRLIPHLVSSLHKLGLPINSSIENRELSLSLIELALEWDQVKLLSSDLDISETMNSDRNVMPSNDVFEGLPSPESSPSKKIKSLEYSQNSMFPDTNNGGRNFQGSRLHQNEINIVVNFLIRLVLLVAMGESTQESLDEKAIQLFQHVVTRWTTYEVRMEYFEKLISMCIKENKQGDINIVKPPDGNSPNVESKPDKQAGTPSRSKGPQSSPQQAKTTDEPAKVSDLLISSCLRLFTSILQDTQQNKFLHLGAEKVCHILTCCFRLVSTDNIKSLGGVLKRFLVSLYSRELSPKLQGMTRNLLEDFATFVVGTVNEQADIGDKSSVTEFDVTLFALSVIDEIVQVKPQLMQSFTNIIISIAEKLAKNLPTVSLKSRNAAKSSYKSSSPVGTLFENACLNKKATYSMKASKSQSVKDATNVSESNTTRDTLILCLRLLGVAGVPFAFTTNRKRLLTILSDILESGTDTEILLIVTAQIGKWVLGIDKKSPLTRTETKHFLKKMSTLEYRGLPEINAQPLHHLISLVALKFITDNRTKWVEIDEDEPATMGNVSDDELSTLHHILNRISSTSLMSSDTALRHNFCALVISENKESIKLNVDVNEDCKSIKTCAILNKSPADALKILLCSDFEGLGYRMWTLVFVDVLLGICDHSGGLNRGESMKSFQTVNPIVFQPEDHNGNSKEHLADSAYTNFLKMLEDFRSGQTEQSTFLTATRILSSCDQNLCEELFSFLFNQAWNKLQNNEERLNMVPHIETFLNRPYHAQFLKIEGTSKNHHNATNGIKSFLQALNTVTPLPMISIDLLISLATNYNCWHEVRSMLERQTIAFEQLPINTVRGYGEFLESAVRRCYLELGEEDTWMSLKSKACTIPGLKYAGSLDMYGRVREAIKEYNSLIDQCDNASSEIEPSDLEMSFIEDRWIALQRETCQWGVLSDLGEESGFTKLMMECAWKNRDWEKLRTLSNSPAAVSALELGDIDVKMNEIFLAIYDGKLNEIENLHAQTAQLCLYKWQLLPPVYAGCNAHLTLLRNFNRLVDIRESGQIMVEASQSQYTTGKSCPDLKNLLNAWRNRLPNDDEPISVWDDIFQWRSHMFTAITNKFQWAEQGTLASLHDRPWTAIRMARAAREQGIPEVSLLSLGKLTDCAMDVADAFSKLNEQILSYQKGSDDEKKGGLNLINTTNLLFFDSRQKSELFRLKAAFLESLGGKTKATQAYCHAVQLCPTYARAWTSWGGLCWSLADLVETQGRKQISSNSAEDKEKKASTAKKVCQYLAQSMGCYLEAIHCDSSEDSRIHLPRCLIMLAKDGASPGLLCSTFEKYAPSLPSWVWLPWIPQLLSSLCRTEARSAKTLLHNVLASYPQAAYFSLRSFYLERRDHERSKTAPPSGPTGSSSVAYAEELMSGLRKSQPTLWMSLESILEELIIRFRPSYEEELLATITALLQRADTQLEHQTRSANSKESDQEAIRTSFTKTLARVSAKFFHSQPDQSSKDDRAKRTAEFTLRYKESFERDFSMMEKDNKRSNLSLDSIISKLKKWKLILECRVSSTPPRLPLMQVSPSLSAFSNNAPDLWSGACDTQAVSSPGRTRQNAETEKDTSPSSSASAALKAAIAAATAVSSANIYEGGGGSKGSGWVSVEIPGQYAPNIAKDSKPSPELHPKLLKFEAIVEVSRRNDQLVRRIGMVGSDGRVYQFLLQFAIPYWTRTDGRTAQLHQLLGKRLRKESVACRRNLWLRPTAVIPIAQRLRMTAEEASHISLDDIYARDCHANGKEYSHAFSYLHNKMKSSRNLTGDATLKATDDKDAIKRIRIEVFKEMCDKIVSSRILTEYVQGQFQSIEQYFQFQRTFASQTALNSLLQYVFGVNERVPSKFIFNNKNAHVLSPDFRFSYSNQGFIDEKKTVPFRLTRNIEDFIGPFLMNGIFIPAMTSAATSISKHDSSLEQALQLLCRDDIVSWYLSKSSQREGSQRSTQELERQLGDRVKKNIYLIQSRIRHCAIKSPNEQKDTSCDSGVRNLISLATSNENLVSMPSNYAAWL